MNTLKTLIKTGALLAIVGGFGMASVMAADSCKSCCKTTCSSCQKCSGGNCSSCCK